MSKVNNKETILVIEDEPEISDFAARVCELEGYRVFQAEDGDVGLKLARQHRVSLVLLDLRLPSENGWVILDKMQGDPQLSSIPVMVFTASAASSQRNRALASGAKDYLVKPLSAAGLKEAIATTLLERE